MTAALIVRQQNLPLTLLLNLCVSCRGRSASSTGMTWAISKIYSLHTRRVLIIPKVRVLLKGRRVVNGKYRLLSIIEMEASKAFLQRWNNPQAKGRVRAEAGNGPFTIKYVFHSCSSSINPLNPRCLGVFDTVGAVGLPEELRFSSKVKRLFSFPDKDLGTHIEHAFHAMALDEKRSDFVSIPS